MSSRLLLWALGGWVVVLGAVGCGPGTVPAVPDAGAVDAGVDAGVADAGVDAGVPDAGGGDAGGADAGDADAGSTDAGSTDAGAPDAGRLDGGGVDAGTCGDGVRHPGEACDDGDVMAGDGCSALCVVESGWHCRGQPSACALAACGDGWRDVGEACDDGNLDGGDGCAGNCALEGLVTEVEPNDTVAQANDAGLTLTTHAVVLGSLTDGVDEDDLFPVVLTAPAVVRFEVFEGTTPGDCGTATTRLRLFNAVGVQLATDDVSGIRGCSAIVMPLGAGTWYVQVEEAGLDGDVPQYALQVAFHTFGGAEVEPNDGEPTATVVTGALDRVVAGDHSVTADSDVYAVFVREGGSLRAELIEGDRAVETCESQGIDSRLTLYGPGFVQRAEDDDDGRGFCSLLDGTGSQPADVGAAQLREGVYYLQVRASPFASTSNSQFSYQLAIQVR